MPTGVNPYVADIAIKDSQGNMAMGSLPVVLYDTDNNPINTTTSANGTAQITLPKYYPRATAAVGGNDFYIGSAGTGAVQYDLAEMIISQAPNFQIIRTYIQTSGAFTYDSSTNNYTWNGNDNWNGLSGCYKWTDSIPFYCSVDRENINKQRNFRYSK